jgi:hypothetical protein
MSKIKQKNLWNLIIKYELPFESSDGYGVGLGLGLLDNAGHKTSRTTSKIMILAFMKINIIRKIFHFLFIIQTYQRGRIFAIF